MITGLKPYSAYKDSEAPWLGKVPEHWEVSPLGRIGRFSKGNGGTKADEVSEGVPCIRYGDLYTQHESFITASRSFVTPERAGDYTSVSYGDVLFAASGETLDEIGKSAVSLIEGSACCGGDVLRFQPNREMIPRFLGYASDCPQSVRQKATMGRGVTVMHIYAHQLKYLWVALPPVPEQSAIVRFLDHADRRIRRYISAKRKLIALLNEQKRAVIHRAVTRGLDPEVRLKAPGVEWLGDVPEHWEVLQLRRRWQVVDCKHVTVPFIDDGVPLASVREVQSFELDLSQAKRTTEEGYTFLVSGERAPARGDLVYCRNVSVGACAYVGTNDRFAMGQDVCLIRSKTENGRFLNYVMHSSAMQRQLSLILIGSTFNRINVSEIKSLVLPLPPRAEQDLIISHLDSQISVFDAPIRIAEREMALLREYRTRLIADVVTGKLDVREAAANLPEVDEEEPLEGAIGGDEITDEVDLEPEAEAAA